MTPIKRRNIRTMVQKEVEETEGQRPDVQTTSIIDVGTSELLNVQTQEPVDAQVSRRYGRKKEREEGRQTVYFDDPDLRKWVRHRAIDENLQVSELIVKAVLEYKSRIEKKT